MKRDSRAFLAVIVATALFVTSCGIDQPSPTEPASAPAELHHRDLGSVVLLSCTPLAADSATATIGPAGGVIEVGAHRLVVPSGALDSAVAITAIMPSDTLSRVRLFPEGLTFARRARLEMGYAHCAGAWIPLPRTIAYLDSDLNILELLESLTNIFEKKVSTRLDHFSDYAVAW
jgi:hypothetical protein